MNLTQNEFTELKKSLQDFVSEYRFENIFCIRLFNDRKKEMLWIPDRSLEQVVDFVTAMKNSDQDYCISNKMNLKVLQKKQIEKIDAEIGFWGIV